MRKLLMIVFTMALATSLSIAQTGGAAGSKPPVEKTQGNLKGDSSSTPLKKGAGDPKPYAQKNGKKGHHKGGKKGKKGNFPTGPNGNNTIPLSSEQQVLMGKLRSYLPSTPNESMNF